MTSKQFQSRAPRIALFVVAGMLMGGVVRAEGPMATDDAGTMDRGGLKVEGVWSRDDTVRGGEWVFGFAPVGNLEIGLTASRATDHNPDPSTRFRASGISFKWVPIQNETGWSLGASFGHGRTEVDERSTPDLFIEKEYAVSGLATYRFGNGQVLHTNLGSTCIKAQGTSASVGTWGIGYEYPIAAGLQLTAEAFGSEHARPDKAVGLRYEAFDGFKILGAVGRGSDRGFGQVGFAWEF